MDFTQSQLNKFVNLYETLNREVADVNNLIGQSNPVDEFINLEVKQIAVNLLSTLQNGDVPRSDVLDYSLQRTDTGVKCRIEIPIVTDMHPTCLPTLFAIGNWLTTKLSMDCNNSFIPTTFMSTSDDMLICFIFDWSDALENEIDWYHFLRLLKIIDYLLSNIGQVEEIDGLLVSGNAEKWVELYVAADPLRKLKPLIKHLLLKMSGSAGRINKYMESEQIGLSLYADTDDAGKTSFQWLISSPNTDSIYMYGAQYDSFWGFLWTILFLNLTGSNGNSAIREKDGQLCIHVDETFIDGVTEDSVYETVAVKNTQVIQSLVMIEQLIVKLYSDVNLNKLTLHNSNLLG